MTGSFSLKLEGTRYLFLPDTCVKAPPKPSIHLVEYEDHADAKQEGERNLIADKKRIDELYKLMRIVALADASGTVQYDEYDEARRALGDVQIDPRQIRRINGVGLSTRAFVSKKAE